MLGIYGTLLSDQHGGCCTAPGHRVWLFLHPSKEITFFIITSTVKVSTLLSLSHYSTVARQSWLPDKKRLQFRLEYQMHDAISIHDKRDETLPDVDSQHRASGKQFICAMCRGHFRHAATLHSSWKTDRYNPYYRDHQRSIRPVPAKIDHPDQQYLEKVQISI
jgi:hypothetical protein